MRKKIKKLQKELIRLGDIKFALHRRKGDWSYKSMDYIIKELDSEIIEFKSEEDLEKKILELGDIFNYLLIIYDKLIDEKYFNRKYKKRKEDGPN